MKLTIFTPTYNRAQLLPRVFDSLKIQRCKNFEWLIVDDGSIDDTEWIVQDIIKRNVIDVRYIKKENGGKHSAHNLAVKNSKGELFLCLDSDDMLAPNAVEKILTAESKLKDHDCGFLALKKDCHGRLLGYNLPQYIHEHCGLYGYEKHYGTKGEFAMIFRTDILRDHLFPIIEGEKFLGECVLYDKLELEGFTFCPMHQVVEICEYQNGGLSNNFYKLLCENPGGYTLYYLQRLKLAKSIKESVKYAIRYNAFQVLFKIRNNNKFTFCNWIVIMTWIPGVIGAYYYLLMNSIKKDK